MSLSALAVEWPEIRGGDLQGVVEAKAAPVKIDFEKDITWKTEIPGKGWSSPVMSGGLIVVTTAVGEEKVELRVVAVDAKTGKIVWNEKVFDPSEEEAAIRHRKNGLASPSALIADGMIYAHFGHMGTAALNLKDGKVEWRYHETYHPVHGNGGSAVLADGVLVFTADGKDKALTRGLDAKTGKKIWEKERGVETSRKFSFGTPLVIEMNGESLVISQGSEHVGTYRPKDGELVWEVDCGVGWSLVPTPVLDEGFVYLATGFMKPRLIAIELKGAAGDVTKSHVKWEAKKDIPKTPSFVIKDDTIYLIEDSGKLSAINKKDGEVLWVESLKRNFSASPMLVGNHFYSFTEEGVGYVHEVSPRGAKQIAENDFGEPIFATPIIFGGTMIVRSETTLWRFKGN
ncbi:MAG: PQQ-binding-like beta-propeller repeat protein [Akkermansiaceae bacterium]